MPRKVYRPKRTNRSKRLRLTLANKKARLHPCVNNKIEEQSKVSSDNIFSSDSKEERSVGMQLGENRLEDTSPIQLCSTSTRSGISVQKTVARGNAARIPISADEGEGSDNNDADYLPPLIVERGHRDLEEVNLTGRRVVDINHLMKQLKVVSTHPRSCKMGRYKLISEYFSGLYCKWTFYCKNCEKEYAVTSVPLNEMDEINDALTWGEAGVGYTKLEDLFSVLNVPILSQCKYKTHETKVGKYKISAVCGLYKLYKRRGDVDEYGEPMLSVTAEDRSFPGLGSASHEATESNNPAAAAASSFFSPTIEATEDSCSAQEYSNSIVWEPQSQLSELPQTDTESCHELNRPNGTDGFSGVDHTDGSVSDMNDHERPAGVMSDTLDLFGRYVASILQQLPVTTSYTLQQKFINEVITAKLEYEKEHPSRSPRPTDSQPPPGDYPFGNEFQPMVLQPSDLLPDEALSSKHSSKHRKSRRSKKNKEPPDTPVIEQLLLPSVIKQERVDSYEEHDEPMENIDLSMENCSRLNIGEDLGVVKQEMQPGFELVLCNNPNNQRYVPRGIKPKDDPMKIKMILVKNKHRFLDSNGFLKGPSDSIWRILKKENNIIKSARALYTFVCCDRYGIRSVLNILHKRPAQHQNSEETDVHKEFDEIMLSEEDKSSGPDQDDIEWTSDTNKDFFTNRTKQPKASTSDPGPNKLLQALRGEVKDKPPESGQPFTCSLCNSSFSKTSDLQQHLHSAHSGIHHVPKSTKRSSEEDGTRLTLPISSANHPDTLMTLPLSSANPQDTLMTLPNPPHAVIPTSYRSPDVSMQKRPKLTPQPPENL